MHRVGAIAGAATLLVALAVGGQAPAAEFPAKDSTVTFVVPFAAGGNSDVNTRILAAGLEKLWPGVKVVVTNVAGAGTQKGMVEVLQAKPDGTTVAHISSGSFFSSYLRTGANAPYGRADFAPIANIQVGTQAVFVLKDSPHKTLKDLLDAAKKAPKQLKMGVVSPLGTAHLGALALQDAAGAEFAIVNLESGAKQTAGLLGGHVDAIVTGIDIVKSHFDAGTIRALATVSGQESAFMPGVKTAKALGFDAQTNPSQGFAVSAKVPKEVVAALSKAIGDVLKMPDIQQKYKDVGAEVLYLDSAAYDKALAEEEVRSKKLIQLAEKATN